MDKFAIKITWPDDGMTVYINRDPSAPDKPMDLGFGWETTGKISNAWTTPDKEEAQALLPKWRESMSPDFGGEGSVINLNEKTVLKTFKLTKRNATITFYVYDDDTVHIVSGLNNPITKRVGINEARHRFCTLTLEKGYTWAEK